MLLSIALGLLVVFVTIAIIRYLRFKAFFDSLPGMEDFRLKTGNLHNFKSFNEEGIQYHMDMMKKHPYYFRVWYGPFVPYICCVHPDLFKALIKSSTPKVHSTLLFTSGYEVGLPWIGKGILLSRGERWKRNRKLLTPSFHFDVLRAYMEAFNKAGDVCLNLIADLTKDGKSVNVQERMSLQSLDVLLQCAFSRESNCQVTGSEYVSAIHELAVMWRQRIQNPLWWNPFLYSFTSHYKKFHQLCDMVHKVADDVISQRKKELENKDLKNVKVKDFLDTLILARDADGNGLDHQDIRCEVDTFMFAGHDTTGVALTFFLYQLARHPEIQEKVYKEVCEVLGERDNVEWSDLNKFEYLTLCVKESLRMHCSIPSIGRRLDQVLEFRGVTFPKGTTFQIHLNLMHKNPAVWENALEFDPDRFLPERAKDYHPFQYVPFSAGNRNCIGQNFAMYEIKTVIPKFLKRFKVTLDESKTVRFVYAISITTEKGIYLHFTPRDSASN